MHFYVYPYERPAFEPGPASGFIVSGRQGCDSLSVGRDNFATSGREGLTEAGRVLIDAVFSFPEIYGLEVSFQWRKIMLSICEPLTDERVTKLNQLIGNLNNLEDWAFIEDARATILANTSSV